MPRILVTLITLFLCVGAFAQTLSVGYQGRLEINGTPANGLYDIEIRFFRGSNISPHFSTQAQNVPVTNGLFTLAFNTTPASWAGEIFWELAVRPSGGIPFTTLQPRFRVNSAPFAIRALEVDWSGVFSKPAGFADNVDNGFDLPASISLSNTSPLLSLTQNGAGGVLTLTGAPTGGGAPSLRVNGQARGAAVFNADTVVDDYTVVIQQTAAGGGLSVEQTGLGPAGRFIITRGNSTANALAVTHSGPGAGLRIDSNGGPAVIATSNSGNAGRFLVSNPLSNANAMEVITDGGGNAIYGRNASSIVPALRVDNLNPNILLRFAAQFSGRVDVIGVLTKSAGAFRIDHPLDPANKYLYHSFVESPDMMNVYNGNVVTNEKGEAWVELPDYFEALNTDFRYQLTILDETDFAQARIAQKIKGNRFLIKTSRPNVEVSWQVTGIRNDPWARDNRIPNTVEKPENERGLYLYPEGYGLGQEQSLSQTANPTK